ncbi:MAG: protein phosphatase 2C domain-containing protein, partial [Planctomycetes bacterium]|nr:protein phosphatase 2C domain-containing protein [Planctomycetota bacterium]
MKIAGRTDPGRVRARNEDALAFDEKTGFLAVADGVGGHAGGATASAMAVEAFRAGFRYRTAVDKRDPEEEKEFLRHLIEKANRAIHARSREPRYAEMGSTLVALSAARAAVAVAHVGDSRAYRFRKGKISRLTRDHSMADARRGFGLFRRSEEEVRRDPMRHVVLRALGHEADVACDAAVHPVRPGDVFLLCTDGLHDALTEKD